jgi:hypothetical protein
MSAGYQNIYLNQGEDFYTTITLYDNNGVPYNLTNFTIASQAKTSYYTANAAIVFSASVFSANSGIIALAANNATTANVSARQKLVYDVYITDNSGVKTRVLEGQVYVSPGVTIPNTSFGNEY